VATSPVLEQEPATGSAENVEPVVPVAAPRPSINFEDLFGRRLPIWAGGITLAIAGVFIVKLAIDAGFFTPWIQVVCGMAFGLGLIGGAELALRGEDKVRDPRVRQALSGAGLATLYASVLMAANGYGLIGPIAAFAGMAVITAAALALSIRFGTPSALLALAGGLATPALVGATQPDVPLLSVYLALTIGGLAAVSRMQRWAWLGVSALLGGAGWSLVLIATGALDLVSSLSVGALVLMLAIGVPMAAFAGPRAALLRTLTALIGAGQLALLVAVGGFTPLNWGMFGLIALAGQWLSWREKGFEIVPSIGLGLAALLLAIWPSPDPSWFPIIGIAMALIHGVPLMWRLWQAPGRFQVAIELAALALAVPAIAAIHFYTLDGNRDTLFALLALAGAVVAALGAGLGWSRPERQTDARFALLAMIAALLAVAATWFVLPMWSWPLSVAAIAAVLVMLGERAADPRLQPVAAMFAVAAVPVLIGTDPALPAEAARLFGMEDPMLAVRPILRWLGTGAAFALIAARPGHALLRGAAQCVAALLAYGTVAQIVPDALLPALVAAAVLALSFAPRRLVTAATTLVALAAAWALLPITIWSGAALLSLAGMPMTIDREWLSIATVVERLLVPALLIGLAVWRARSMMSDRVWRVAAALVAVPLCVGAHCAYRIAFAAVAGSDFVATGLAERCIWAGLLITGGWAISRRQDLRGVSAALVATGTLHALVYTLGLHNPLWAAQQVGAIPIANLLIPAFGLVPLGLWLLDRVAPEAMARIRPVARGLRMLIVILFAYATLRQAFAGSLLVTPGLGSVEDIMRSILAILLAIGFLLWGIRSNGRDWRIASLVLMLAAVGKVFLFDASGLEGLLRIGSFVALGFSLIGIGWLYSRQLARPADNLSVTDQG
jgi:uncharacterized membrane protein